MEVSLPDVSIIIVSWNVCPLLRACLTSLARQNSDLRLQTIVVDSGSVDGSAEMVAEQFPAVELIRRSDNVGFPRGNNIGLRHARGRYVLLLNPDTEVARGALATLVSFMDRHPEVAVVGPLLRAGNGSVQSSRRRFPTLLTAFLESTWLESWAPRGVLERYHATDLPDGVAVDVDWVVGAALMVRHSVADTVGPMDEAYFMYSEELDWCRRIKDAGWRVVHVPAAEIIHHEGKSSEQAVTARHINFQRAKLRYFYKYHGRLAASILRLFLLANYAAQLGIEAAKGFLGHRRELRRQRMSSYWQVLKSRLRIAGEG